MIKYFYFPHRWGINRFYHTESGQTYEQWQWRSYSQKLYDWSLTIRGSLVSYPEHSLRGSYYCAEMQPVYYTVPVDWAVLIFITFFFLFYVDYSLTFKLVSVKFEKKKQFLISFEIIS